MKNVRAHLYLLGAFVWAALPFIAQAALVPCGLSSNVTTGTGGSLSCDLCMLGQLVQNIINFIIGLSVPASALLFAWAGVLYFSGRGSLVQIEKAHKIFSTTLIGFLIVLAGWLVIQVTLNTLVQQNFFANIGGNWNSLKCVDASKRGEQTNRSLNEFVSSSLPGLAPYIPPAGDNPVYNATCPAGYTAEAWGCFNSLTGDIQNPTYPSTVTRTGGVCAGECVGLDLPTQSTTCAKAPGGSCLVTKETADALIKYNNELKENGLDLIVTAAIGGTHVASCQNTGFSNSGSCIDGVVGTPGNTMRLNPESLITSYEIAQRNGLRQVTEVSTNEQRDEIRTRLIEQGITPQQAATMVITVPGVRPHNSIYLAAQNPTRR